MNDRIPIIAGNWKMNKTVEQTMQLLEAMVDDLDVLDQVDKVICPPFVALYPAIEILEETDIALGAQNMYWEEAGAYTGEVSPLMLRELVDFVIIGHSERRKFFGETDQDVNNKVKAALRHDITPIVAIGEDLAQNQAGITNQIVTTQLKQGLAGISAEDATNIILAYEPIWAIGTGMACLAIDANQVAAVLRQTLTEMFGEEVAQAMRIQYGGSVNSKNIADIMAQPEIDGALVGGASLDPNDFVRIVAITQDVYAKRGR
jgi:triosephosphate isomerase